MGPAVGYNGGAGYFDVMSESNTLAKAPALALEPLTLLLNDPARWFVLRELAKGEPLPVHELARRLGRSTDSISKHLAVRRRVGGAVVGFGRLYALAPAFRPAPGTAVIDFGPCVVRLDSPWS